MTDIGIKISSVGQDVSTTSDKNLILNTKYFYKKGRKFGKTILTANPGETKNFTYNHLFLQIYW